MQQYELDIIQRLKSGDEWAMEEIFITYYVNLCSYAFGFVRDKSDAEDIVSEGMVWIWENRQKLKVNTSLRAYLYRFIHNRCVNFIEHKRVKNRYSEKVIILHKDELHRVSEGSNHPLNQMLAEETNRRISEAIESLPEQCKDIFKLSRYSGLKNKEIAEKLNLAETTIKKQISIALKKIRDFIYIVILLVLSVLK